MFQLAGARQSNPNIHTPPVWQLANIRVNSTDILTLICASVCWLKDMDKDGTYNRIGQRCTSQSRALLLRVHLLHWVCSHTNLLPLDLAIHTCVLEHNLHLIFSTPRKLSRLFALNPWDALLPNQRNLIFSQNQCGKLSVEEKPQQEKPTLIQM